MPLEDGTRGRRALYAWLSYIWLASQGNAVKSNPYLYYTTYPVCSKTGDSRTYHRKCLENVTRSDRPRDQPFNQHY